VVLNVDGSSPSGHPRRLNTENAGNPCKSAGFPVFHRQEFDFHFWLSVPNLKRKLAQNWRKNDAKYKNWRKIGAKIGAEMA